MKSGNRAEGGMMQVLLVQDRWTVLCGSAESKSAIGKAEDCDKGGFFLVVLVLNE
ncbi:MAG: hypothetical protein AAGL89_10705 [Pseudomonadota bacterium]